MLNRTIHPATRRSVSSCAGIVIPAVLACGGGALAGCNEGPTAPNPPVRHTLSGTISESGAGPIGDVSVSAGEGKLSVTDERGQYQIQGLSGRVNVTLEKPGFERMVVFGTTMAHDHTLDTAIQRAIHITPGERANVTIFGDDGDYDFAYTGCSAPCKVIRLAIDTPGVLSVGVRALDESRVVYLLIEPVPGNFSPGASGVGKVTLTTPQGVGEMKLYVAFGGGYQEGANQTLEISTTFDKRP
jgi:hypothetical protein